MTKKLASLATIATVVVIGLVFSGHRVGGQQSPQTQVYPDVWQEIAHDTAGPMSQLGRPAPRGGPPHSVNWLKREHQPQHGPADSVIQSSSGPLVGTTGLLNFGGVGANGFAPPDTNGAVGATQYVQWVNVEYAVYNKSNGALVQGPFAGNSFWAGFADSQCASKNSGDPIAQYDKAANRWVMMQPVFTSPTASASRCQPRATLPAPTIATRSRCRTFPTTPRSLSGLTPTTARLTSSRATVTLAPTPARSTVMPC